MNFSVTSSIINLRVPEGGARIVAEEAGRYLESMRDELEASVKFKMREGVSRSLGRVSEKDNVRSQSIGGLRPSVRVWGDLVQTNVDEGGRKSGAAGAGFPPFGPGSLLRDWVVGILQVDEDEVASVTFLVARKIHQRGLPRPGDPLRQPFEETWRQYQGRIDSGLRDVARDVTRTILRGMA